MWQTMNLEPWINITTCTFTMYVHMSHWAWLWFRQVWGWGWGGNKREHLKVSCCLTKPNKECIHWGVIKSILNSTLCHAQAPISLVKDERGTAVYIWPFTCDTAGVLTKWTQAAQQPPALWHTKSQRLRSNESENPYILIYQAVGVQQLFGEQPFSLRD